MTWGSIHVFYAEHDDLLIDCLSGLAGRLKASGEISHAFFLRHWRNGPHIRFRLRVHDSAGLEQVLAATMERIEGYIAAVPSTTVVDPSAYQAAQQLMAQWEVDDETPGHLIANNSVRVEPYHRELGKYGGRRGAKIAEDLADASSNCVLRLLPVVRDDRGGRTSLAYVMTVSGALAAGLRPDALAPFLADYSRLWSHWAPSSTRAAWDRNLTKNWDRLRIQTERLLCGPPPSSPILREWSTAVATTAAAIDESEGDVLPAVTALGSDAEAQARRRYLLTNYLHTNNNRLGVLPAEEAFIAFLACRVVESLCRGQS
jgi:hypothetical protein